jgi:DNA-binding NtrC family response regulator
VLLEGETGTGKDLVARAIHEASPRAMGPLSVFDCASVPGSLIESELFGHERGAFTGAATRRVGRLEEATGGTFFIDELGELPLELQPRLLRALEAREVRRLGGDRPIPIDVRVVAATHRDLAREVNRGSFREDLYYRLAVVRATVPPLRDRRDDLPMLVEHFVTSACGADRTRAATMLAAIDTASWQRLAQHPWPGNVRELRNSVERAIALSRPGETVSLGVAATPGDFEARRASASSPPPDPGAESTAPSPELAIDLGRPFMEQKAEFVARFERAYLEAQLARHGGNITRAAAASGLDRMYFKKLLRKP